MVKRILSLFIAVIMLLPNICVTANDKGVNSYTPEQMEYIYNTYFEYRDDIEKNLCKIGNFQYWSMVENTDEKKVFSWLIDTSSDILKVTPVKQKYVEMLSGIIAMQETSLANQIANQSQFDDIKGDFDYAMDFIGLGTSFFGIEGSDVAKNVSTIVEILAGGTEMLAENAGQAKYYLASIQSYTQMMCLLNAVEKNAEIPELKETAIELKSIGDSLLQKRLEYISANGENIVEYEAEFFKENLFWKLLKEADLYKNNQYVKWLVDKAENIVTSLKPGKFVFGAMILIGDLAFGTNNTFIRYQEMKAMADIAQSLYTEVSDLAVGSSPDSKTIGNIGTKCNYYNSLIAVHARGEYLVYSLLNKDAGLLSQIRELKEMFKEYEETTPAWYEGKLEKLSYTETLLKDIFDVDFCETVGEKPKLQVYGADNKEFFNYHCKIETAKKDSYVMSGKEMKLVYETVDEFDVTEQKEVVLDKVVEPASGQLCSYKITVTNLGDEDADEYVKFVMIGNNEKDLEFSTDFKHSENIFSKIPDERFCLYTDEEILYVYDDGTFVGESYCPCNSIVHKCYFKGAFSMPIPVTDNVYSTAVTSFEFDDTKNIECVAPETDMLQKGDKFHIYMPGALYSDIDNRFIEAYYLNSSDENKLSSNTYGLRNLTRNKDLILISVDDAPEQTFVSDEDAVRSLLNEEVNVEPILNQVENELLIWEYMTAYDASTAREKYREILQKNSSSSAYENISKAYIIKNLELNGSTANVIISKVGVTTTDSNIGYAEIDEDIFIQMHGTTVDEAKKKYSFEEFSKMYLKSWLYAVKDDSLSFEISKEKYLFEKINNKWKLKSHKVM